MPGVDGGDGYEDDGDDEEDEEDDSDDASFDEEDKEPLMVQASGVSGIVIPVSCPCCPHCSPTFRIICCILLCVIFIPTVIMALDVEWLIWNRARTNLSGDACPVAYDPNILEPLTQAARAAFCLDDQAEKMITWQCDPCITSGLKIVNGTYRPVYGDFLHSNSTYAYVVKLSDEQGKPSSRFGSFAGACLIAFRGSLNFYNVIADADFQEYRLDTKYNCPNCLVHFGFFHAWQSMENETVATLGELGCHEIPLIITGHSLGAAMATLATWTLTQVYGFELRMFYSFESPRVGDPAFHEAFDSIISVKKPAFRLTYYNDAVVHAPPGFSDFEHVNCEIYYDQKGRYTICQNDEDPSCSARWALLQTNFNLNGDINGSGAHCHPSYEPTGDICHC